MSDETTEAEFSEEGQGVGPMYDRRAYEAGERAATEHLRPVLQDALAFVSPMIQHLGWVAQELPDHAHALMPFERDAYRLFYQLWDALDAAHRTYLEGEAQA